MREDRGQLMLVGAITIAVIFLGLVTVLNTGLYTSNVAPRAGLSATADAETFVDGVQHDVPLLLGSAAEGSVEGNVYAFDSVVDDEIERYETYLLRSVGSERAAVINVSLSRTVEGSGGLIVDDDPDTAFDPESGSQRNWTLARNATETGGRITIYEFPTHNATSNATFTLRATERGGGDVWTLDLFWSERDEEVHLRTNDGETYRFEQEQATNASGVTLNISGSAVRLNADGTGDTLSTADAVLDGNYSLSIRRFGPVDATRARGTYGIGTDGTITRNVTDAADPGAAVPYSVPHLGEAVLDLRYTTSSLDYNTTIRTEPTTADLPRPTLIGRGVVFVNESDGGLRSIAGDGGSVTTYDATDVGMIGPAEADFDADGRVEIPHVNTSGTIRLIDEANESTTLPAAGVDPSDSSRLAVGTWNGSPISVFYAADDSVYRITPGGSPVRLKGTEGYGVTAPVGPADIDGDDSREFVYVDGGGQLRYVDDTGTEEIGDGDVAGSGVGPAHDFDGDGSAEVPFVDDDNHVTLINENEGPVDLFERHNITDDEPVDSVPLAVRDVDDDRNAEIVYLRDGQAHYLDGVGTDTVVEEDIQPRGTGNSTTVTASEGEGVA